MSELADLSLQELSKEIETGRFSPEEAAEACLRRIEERDGVLNSFITVRAEEALAEARALGEELAQGRYRGPLHGVPIGLKDLYQAAGLRTTAGSLLLRDWVPGEDATVVRRLREAGAVLLGKQNMHEFAYGATNENPHYGPTRNPHDTERITGGSSGGTAAAVAAGLCYGGLGSDTGGSIRCPAALCGIVGLKPTYGRVSRAGVVPLAWSLDHVGPMTRTVGDTALMLEAIAGHDPHDPTTTRRPVPPYANLLDGGVRGLRLGVPREWFWDAIHPEVEREVRAAFRALEEAGARVEEISLPCLEYAAAAQTTTIMAEATAYHRNDLRERAGDYGPDVRMRLVQGLFISAADYLDAQRARRRARREVLERLKEFDALLTPAVGIPAPRVGQKRVAAGEVEAPPLYFMVRNTFIFNMTGMPAVSVPCGRAEGLPVGLQIAGRPWEEATVLRIARAVEECWTPPPLPPTVPETVPPQ